MIWIEFIATIFGIICVWLTIRQNIWCWPTGLIQVILFSIIFYHAKLYSDFILHIIYIVLSLYGWYHWLYGGKDNSFLQVTRLRRPFFFMWVFIAVAGTLLWGFVMKTLTDASVPYPDAFTTVASLIAQWLMARKRLESWCFWIAVDVVAIGVYFYKQLFFTTGLYAVFLILAIMGFLEWRKNEGTGDRPNARQVRTFS